MKQLSESGRSPFAIVPMTSDEVVAALQRRVAESRIETAQVEQERMVDAGMIPGVVIVPPEVSSNGAARLAVQVSMLTRF